jgi:hypothetical protein
VVAKLPPKNYPKFMAQAQSSSGSCNYAQAMVDQGPRYDSQVRKPKRRKKKKGEK